MPKFPGGLENRIWIALDVGKHIPAAVLLSELSRADMPTTRRELTSTYILKSHGYTKSAVPFHKLLEKAGLAVQQTDGVGEPIHGSFVLTYAGDTYGRQIADVCLNYVAANDSLIPFFGKDIAFRKPTLHKYHILDNLYCKNPEGGRRITHVVYDLGDSSVNKYIHELADAGLIDLHEEEVDENIHTNLRIHYPRRKELAKLDQPCRRIGYAILTRHDSVYKICKYTGLQGEVVLDSLHELAKMGLLATGRSFANRKKVTVQISDKGKAFVENFIEPLEQAIDKIAAARHIEEGQYQHIADKAMFNYMQSLRAKPLPKTDLNQSV